MKRKDLELVLKQFGLTDFFHEKITLNDVIKKSIKLKKLDTLADIPWQYLSQILMANPDSRDIGIQKQYSMCKVKEQERGLSMMLPTCKNTNTSDFGETENSSDAYDPLLSIVCKSSQHKDPESYDEVSPQDIVFATILCCSPFLQRLIINKMNLCRLALPFIFRTHEETVMYLIWPYRSILSERIDGNGLKYEDALVDQPNKIVTFLRFGYSSTSKSETINRILSDKTQNTFYHRNCPLGYSKRVLCNGAVEISWFYPTGREIDVLKEPLAFLNVRGDGLKNEPHIQTVMGVSNLVIAFIDSSVLQNNDEIIRIMSVIHEKNVPVVFALDATSHSNNALKNIMTRYIEQANVNDNLLRVIRLSSKKPKKSLADILQHFREIISDLLQLTKMGKSMIDCVSIFTDFKIECDEDTTHCKNAEQKTCQIMKKIEKLQKKEILQLQDKLWTEWSLKQKEYNRAGTNLQYKDKNKVEKEMRKLREQQNNILSKMSPVLENIFDNIIEIFEAKQNNSINYFLHYLQQKLDKYSNKVLPELSRDYHFKWNEWKTACENGIKNNTVEALKQSVDKAEMKLSQSAFGIEHIIREFGQMYEASEEINNANIRCKANSRIQKLPEVVAHLILQGLAFEIMDGDAANIPISWISSVFLNLQKLTINKKLLTISILGIQSSGKSTLLNCMFGLEFPVRAGRCTRGVFMRLIPAPVDDYPFDHILVVDTEGLRAPELGMQKYDHDNELATFVIGIGDITLLNIKGENTSEVQDVLQIAVHAFMKLVLVNSRIQLQQSCIFVHQNVSVTDTKSNLVHSTQKNVETLDKMTKEAAETLHIANIQTFNQVIQFESKNDIWYFPDLWYGDPPMASTNPGYSKNVEDLRYAILTKAAKRSGHLNISETSQRIHDLWKGILSEDFVFTFRNTLEIKAYTILDTKFQEFSSELRTFMFDYYQNEVKGKLATCQETHELELTCRKCTHEFRKVVLHKLQIIKNELESYFDKSPQKDILVKWKNTTLNKLEIFTETCIFNETKDIEKKKEMYRLDLLGTTTTLENDKKEINQRAKELAAEMKGKKLKKYQLKKEFNSMMKKWKERHIPPTDENELTLNDQVKEIMFQRLSTIGAYLKEVDIIKTISYKTMGSLSESIKLEHILDKHISISSFLHNGSMKNKDFSICAKKTLQVTENIFLKADVSVEKKVRLDEKFNSVFITELLDIIVGEIDKFNSRKNKQFNILDTYKAFIAVHVCNYAKTVYSQMNDRYEVRHGWKAKFEEHEKVVWGIFQHTFDEKATEYISATLLKDDLVQTAINQISEVISEDVKKFIRSEIGSTKHALMTLILDSLANKASFKSIRSYIQSSKDFALKWLFNFAKNKLFETKFGSENGYCKIANEHIKKIMRNVSESIVFASENTKNNNAHTWLKHFSSNMCSSLPSIDPGLRNVYAELCPKSNISDFVDFVKTETKTMERMILAEFKSKTPKNISWCCGNPIEKLFMELWGCDQHCPFCHEPCQFTMTDHLDHTPHKCLQHRPPALVDVYDEDSKELFLEVCNFTIKDGTRTFNCHTCEKECRKSGQCIAKDEDDDVYHSFRDYKKYIPNWDIAPDSTLRSSDYWSWVIATFKDKINKLDDEFKLPEIPEAWTRLTKKQAKDSLRY